MSDLRYAKIGFKDAIAGTLSEAPAGGTVFEYSSEFKETIACALPRSKSTHAWPEGLHPFFQHLAPEGWLRSRQARAAEVDVEDDFGLLLKYGADCIGAVSVLDSEAYGTDFEGIELDALTRAAVEPKRTVSGIQPKLLVTKEKDEFIPAQETGKAEYIAKFPTDDLPDIVLNEDLSLEAARVLLGKAQVTIAKRSIVKGIDRPALLVERFDRTDDNRKLRLEDFAQVLSRPRRRDFSGKYDASFEEGAKIVKRYSVRSEIDLLRYFSRIVAFALIGNCDSHLKNFSLLETGEGLRLSPAYDVVNTYIYGAQGYSTRFGLLLGGERRQFEEINHNILTQFGEEIGLNKHVIERTFSDFKEKRGSLLGLYESGDHQDPEGLQVRCSDVIRGSYLRIFGHG